MSSDFTNPYQSPESVGQQKNQKEMSARPIIAFLLTTFGGGAILVLALVLFLWFGDGMRPMQAIIKLSDVILMIYGVWVCIPGLFSGIISSQITRKISTNRELAAVAIFLIVCVAAVGVLSGMPTRVMPLMSFVILAGIFQFWFAGWIGHVFQGTGESIERTHD